MSDNSTCCPDTDLTGFHPRNFRGYTRKGNPLRLYEIENPIPNEVKDTDKIRDFFRRYPFIPYAGFDRFTAHSLLQRMIDMKHLSVTHGSCIESKKRFAFGAKIDVIRNFNPVFDLGEDEESVDIATKRGLHRTVEPC